MPLRPCLDCGKPSQGTRCPMHADIKRRQHNARVRPHSQRRPDYTYAEVVRRREAVDAHRAVHGDWCPGWGRPAHASADLTADHLHAVGAGGAEGGELGVLCRSCNSSKQHRR